MTKPRVLIVERRDAGCFLQHSLEQSGLEVVGASASEAVHALLRLHCDLIILSHSRCSDWHPPDLIRRIRAHGHDAPVILVVEQSSEDLAISALKCGVKDYFKRPLSLPDLSAAVFRWLSDCRPPPSVQVSSADRDLVQGWRMTGTSPSIMAVKGYINKVAGTDTNVLITGETGTGKELTAELIHRNSARRGKPFVLVNCAAIPDTLLESELFGYERGAFTGAHASRDGKLKHAHGGTVFFDEIGDMNLYAQAKILRAIENREVQRLGSHVSTPIDIRIISATNQDLERLMAEHKFRPDLYFRLKVAWIHLPPLKDRKEDIPSLCQGQIEEFNRKFGCTIRGLTEETLKCLLRYDWPGNVRELRNIVEAIFVTCSSGDIAITDLPEHVRALFQNVQDLRPSERDRVLSALCSTKWNRTKAAAMLHWSRMTLYRKIVKYEIAKPVGPREKLWV